MVEHVKRLLKIIRENKGNVWKTANEYLYSGTPNVFSYPTLESDGRFVDNV
jgi:hypothetical protein